MKSVSFVLALIISGLFIYFGSISLSIGDTKMPPIATFMSPYQGFWVNAESSQHYNKNISDLDITDQIEIVFNDREVPFIYAQNNEDLFFAQGYVHGHHRLWQIDMLARAASGQLAEILGSNLIEYDKTKRRLGLMYASEQALEGIKKDTETYEYYSSYVDGLNAYVNGLRPSDYPIEYKIMGFSPREFSVLDVMIIYTYMSYDLSFRNNDLEATLTRQVLGDSMYGMLFPESTYESNPTIPNQDNWSNITGIEKSVDSLSIPKLMLENDKLVTAFSQLSNIKPDKSNGSNNWAISGSKSKSGKPILANDPHLSLTLPSIWYEIQLKSNDIFSYGVSIPGVPGVILGFNETTAWGSTNVGQDVADWYHVNWTSSNLETYELDGIEHKPTIRPEVIRVKGQEDIVLNLPVTKAGIIPFTEKDEPLYGYAFHWLGHEESRIDQFATFINLDKGENLENYKEAINSFGLPPQNLVFASKDGDIALTAQGKYPIRSAQSGKFITEANSSTDLWQSYIPKEQIPQEINPETGYVSSANQKTTSDDYPYYYAGYFEKYRNKTLDSLLISHEDMTIADFKAFQLNNYNMEAKHFINVVSRFIDRSQLDKLELDFFDSFKNWDYTYHADSETAVKCEIWINETYYTLLDEWDLDTLNSILLYPDITDLLILLGKDPEFAIWDNLSTPEYRETAQDILQKTQNSPEISSITSASEKYAQWQETRNQDLGAWAAYKGTRVSHMAKIDAFSPPVLNTGGHGSALNAQKSGHGPSWRMIVSLEDSIKGYGVFPGGQSGNPGSRNYDSSLPHYIEGAYHTLLLHKSPENVININYKWELSHGK